MVVEADLEAVDEKDDPTQYMLGEIDDDAVYDKGCVHFCHFPNGNHDPYHRQMPE